MLARCTVGALCMLLVACRKEPVPAPPPAIVTVDASTRPLEAALDASAPAPAASALSPDAPADVRVEILATGAAKASMKSEVRVGQTFGILLHDPADWMDRWEVKGCDEEKAICPLGYAIANRWREEGAVHERIWRLTPDQVGPHVLEVRLIDHQSRTDQGHEVRRIHVTVNVLPGA